MGSIPARSEITKYKILPLTETLLYIFLVSLISSSTILDYSILPLISVDFYLEFSNIYEISAIDGSDFDTYVVCKWKYLKFRSKSTGYSSKYAPPPSRSLFCSVGVFWRCRSHVQYSTELRFPVVGV